MRGVAAHRRPDAKPSAKRPHPARAGLLSLTTALWLMVWGGYNTDITRLFEPGFPAGLMDFFHGVRSVFPLIAAFLASLMMLRRGSIPQWPLKGPVGLAALYALVGVVSSILLSRDPLTALYWATEYGSVLIVLWAILSDVNTIESLDRLLTVNWTMVAGAVISFLALVGFLADEVLIPTEGSPLGVEAFGGPVAGLEFLGMPGTRNTGFGRFAALTALIVLARLWERKERSIFLCALLPVSLFALVLSQARAAVIGFLAGVFMLFWIKPGSKIIRWAGALFGLVLLGLNGSYGAFWAYIMKGQPLDPTLTGRTITWQEAWKLFLDSPLLGFGFQADRIFPYSLAETAHAHNALVQALIQTGLLGTVPLVAALVIAWILVLRLYRGQTLPGVPRLPLEIPALLAFVTVSSITESTFALYSVYWLMLAPCFAYLQLAMRQRRRVELRNAVERPPRLSFPRQPKDTAAATAPGALQHSTGRG